MFLELDVRTRIADTRISDGETRAALLIPHPLDRRMKITVLLLQSRQRTKKHADRVAPTDGILCSGEISSEVSVGTLCVGRREG